jgi:pimeloyl-ACP methyl ester carboxylesterase
MALIALRRLCLASALVASMAGLAFAQQHVEGSIGPGSLYVLDLPEAWNGDLVVYAHGIVDPALAVQLPSSQDGFDRIRATLLARGFAVAASSFSENGFALKDATQRTHQLSGLFTARFGPPRRVLLAGHSLGSMAALQLAETFPTQYDGALVMCGFVSGTPNEIEYMATARLAFDYFFPGVIPGSVFVIPEELDYRPPSASNPSGSPLFAAVFNALLAGLTPPFPTIQFAMAAGLPGTGPTEWVNSALNVIGFNLRYTRNLLAYTNGHVPFDNRDVVYAHPGLNAGIGRWQGSPEALGYAARHYTPTADLRVPVQTLHTDRDPVVPVWHEDIYATRAEERGATDLLRQTRVSAYGHCAFTDAQVLAAFDQLLARLP